MSVRWERPAQQLSITLDREDLLEAGYPSISILEAKGSGRQKGITEHYRGAHAASRAQCGFSCYASRGSRGGGGRLGGLAEEFI